MVVDKGWVGFSFGFTFNKMMGQWGGVDGCNSGMGCVWVSSSISSWVFKRVTIVSHGGGVSGIKWVGRGSIGNNLLSIYDLIIGGGLGDGHGYAGHDRVSGVSVWVVMGSQVRSSMVVDKGWVGFSFGFTFNKMMGQWGGVDGCNSGMGCVWVSSSISGWVFIRV